MDSRKPADVGRAGAARWEARARWAREGWVRDLAQAEVDALMRCAAGAAGADDVAAAEDLVLECAGRYCPAQPAAPRPAPAVSQPPRIEAAHPTWFS